MDVGVFGIPLAEFQLDGGGMGHFQVSDREGPEPSRVEVGVSERVDGVFELDGKGVEGLFKDFSAAVDGAGFFGVVEVADVVKGSEEGVVAGVFFGVRFEEVEGEFAVVKEGEAIFGEGDEVETVESFGELGARFFRALDGGFEVMGVGLDEEVDFFGVGGEAEEAVAEIEAADLGVVLPEGAFDVGVVFPVVDGKFF